MLDQDPPALVGSDKRAMRRISYLLLFAVATTWCGLFSHSKPEQVIGSLLCLALLGWVAVSGWRVMRRCAQRIRDSL